MAGVKGRSGGARNGAGRKRTRPPVEFETKDSKIAGSSSPKRQGSAPGERRGGRKKGTPNKRTLELMAPVTGADKLTPKFVMLEAMRIYWEQGKIAEAVECAAKVAPYEHPRLTAIAPLNVNSTVDLKVSSDEQRRRAIDSIREAFQEAGGSGEPRLN